MANGYLLRLPYKYISVNHSTVLLVQLESWDEWIDQYHEDYKLNAIPNCAFQWTDDSVPKASSTNSVIEISKIKMEPGSHDTRTPIMSQWDL